MIRIDYECHLVAFLILYYCDLPFQLLQTDLFIIWLFIIWLLSGHTCLFTSTSLLMTMRLK